MKMTVLKGVLFAMAVPLCFTACDEDEPKPANIGFAETEVTVLESDGTTKSFHPLQWQQFSGSAGATGRTVQVKLSLSKALRETAVISYTMSGTAKRNTTASIGDYEATGTVTIEKGATEAFIDITLFEDFELELTENASSETIILTLENVVSGPAVLGEQTSFTMTVEEDDAIIILAWENTAVDMDLFLWLDNEYLTASAQEGNSVEGVYIPAGFPNGTYGMSYTYYAGPATGDVPFTSTIVNLGGNLGSTSGADGIDFNATYKPENKNRYDASEPGDEGHEFYKGDPQIVQTMVKNGLNYTSVTQILPPSSGSRVEMSSKLTDRKALANKKFLQYLPK